MNRLERFEWSYLYTGWIRSCGDCELVCVCFTKSWLLFVINTGEIDGVVSVFGRKTHHF